MLLESKEILKIESRFISLFKRTFFKGVSGQPASAYKDQVSKWFKSKTFEKQVDSIIDDIYLTSVSYTDKQVKKALKASLQRSHTQQKLYASEDDPLILTEVAVRQAEGLAGEVTESIVQMLKDDGLYKESPQKLASIVQDLWGGEKYRATRFVRTFTADVATSTSLYRYAQHGLEEYQIYAKIDERTSQQCRALHGTVFKVGSPEASRYHPPFHQNCRTAIVPVTIFSEIDDSWRYENRDFSKQMKQDFAYYEKEVDKDDIKKVFKDIDTFNEKYRISQFILDEDLQKRFAKLSVGIYNKTSKNEMLFRKELLSYKDTEHCIITDEAGNILGETTGEANTGFVELPNLKELSDPKKLLTLYHNHPGGGTFSKNDILMLSHNPGLETMWAYAEEGSYYVKIIDGVDRHELWETSKNIYSDNEWLVKDKIYDLLDKEKISQKEAKTLITEGKKQAAKKSLFELQNKKLILYKEYL